MHGVLVGQKIPGFPNSIVIVKVIKAKLFKMKIDTMTKNKHTQREVMECDQRRHEENESGNKIESKKTKQDSLSNSLTEPSDKQIWIDCCTK